VAASEAGNSATAGATFIPLFAFGIPGSATAALFGAALIMMGITPGPTMVQSNTGIIMALFIILIYANFFNLGASKLLLPIYSRLAMIQARYVLPIVFALAILGTYAAGNSVKDVWVLLGAGLLGVGLRWFGVPLGPLVLGFIVGPGLEESLRQALMLNRNDWTQLVMSPLALGIYGGTILLLIAFWLFTRKSKPIVED
jgi:putative tricarboxylic transport membrane protein